MVKKTTALALTVLLLSNCSTTSHVEVKKATYDPVSGCSSYVTNSERLRCISELVSVFEDVQNSDVSYSNVSVQRNSDEYVTYVDRYCYESKRTKKHYLCFEVSTKKYEPTPGYVLRALLKHVGVGFLVGVLTGVYVTP